MAAVEHFLFLTQILLTATDINLKPTLLFSLTGPIILKTDKLRQYIIELEASRKLQDLVDVNFTRTVKKGDFLVYDNTSGKWVLTDFLSGGEF